MKILIFGGTGKIGSAVAWDLVKEDAVESVGLVGRRRKALLDVKKWVKSKKITIHSLDITDKRQTQQLMQRYNVGVNALPDRRTSYSVFHAAAEPGFSLVDMLEEYHQRPDAYELEGLKLPKKMTLNKYGDAIRKAGKLLAHVHACGSDRGTPGGDHIDWKGIAKALKDIKYNGDVVIESFTTAVKVIARAAAIWRRIEPTRDEIAVKGLKFLRKTL